MSEDRKSYKAVVTLGLANRKVGKTIIPGALVKAGQDIPSTVSDEWIEKSLEMGLIYEDGSAPFRKDVTALRREKDLNVSSVERGELEENPLDGGIDLAASGDDPALEQRLREIEAEQAEGGVDAEDGADDVRRVEVNAETGEVIETGGDPDFDDDEAADSQVS